MSKPKPPKEVWVLFNQPLVNEPGAFATSVMLPVSNNGPIFHPNYVRYVLAELPKPIASSPLTDEEKRILAEMDDDEQPKRLEDEFDIVQVSDNLVSYTPKRKLPTCRICGSVYAVAYGGGVCGKNGCDNKPKRKRAKKRSK